MAKAGRSGGGSAGTDARASATRQALVDAAIDSLRFDGFSGASARSIAARAQSNQALVFYHFGSVTGLLLAALDEVSARRMERYDSAARGASSPGDLAEVAAQIFREDLDQGYITVLVEMMAAATTIPTLGAEVANRIHPWFAFTQQVITEAVASTPFASLVPVDDAAYAVVALYLGLELLSHLDNDRGRALSLFARVQAMIGSLGSGTFGNAS